jgi:hypothetical protein
MKDERGNRKEEIGKRKEERGKMVQIAVHLSPRGRGRREAAGEGALTANDFLTGTSTPHPSPAAPTSPTRGEVKEERGIIRN